MSTSAPCPTIRTRELHEEAQRNNRPPAGWRGSLPGPEDQPDRPARLGCPGRSADDRGPRTQRHPDEGRAAWPGANCTAPRTPPWTARAASMPVSPTAAWYAWMPAARSRPSSTRRPPAGHGLRCRRQPDPRRRLERPAAHRSAGQGGNLATEADGVPFAFTDDLDIASDGRIYFSDASSKFHQPDYILDLLEARPHGRLLRYDPSTGKTEVLLRTCTSPMAWHSRQTRTSYWSTRPTAIASPATG